MKKVKILISSLVLAMLFSNCDSYLSEVPDNRTQLDSEQKIAELLVSAYPSGMYIQFMEDYTDNVTDSGLLASENVNNTQYYKWELGDDVSVDSPSHYWDTCYAAIATANQALEALDELGDKISPSKREALRSEALLARAYAHFQLVLIWGKAYNPATAASDLGVPYVDRVEGKLVQQYKRNTVAEVYEKIEADLVEGLKGITNNYNVPQYHFNKNAANALAVRFYLFKGEWDKVIKYSSYVGTKPGYNVIRDVKTWSGTSSYVEAWQAYSRTLEPTNILLATGNSYASRTPSRVRFTMTGALKNKLVTRVNNPLAAKDYYWNRLMLSANQQQTVFLPKHWEYFKLDNPSAGTGYGYTTDMLFTNDEVYLNRIEALVMEKRYDEAKTELEYFLGTRTNGYNASSDKLSLNRIKSLYTYNPDELTPFYPIDSEEQWYWLKTILEVKRIEQLQEGKRWFDIKRFNIVVTHQYVDGSGVDVLEKDDLRRQLPLPLHVVASGVQDNPKK
ncbi:RagB/SusD family nutrient uptake outer membrane protein [Myroides injenensis]|uniref:RagB/SusD family nutrient uptake outer membrane protein n=1 Tax=Myroides injenensis TaxID=1183151 RepID=UPI000289A4BC|nr:RagB/SusD family nutrient uptake outer membrane protein [Myroides injenensis]